MSVLVSIEDDTRQAAAGLRLTVNDLRRATRETMQTVQRETLREFRRTTATWEHKPQFEALSEGGEDSYIVMVGTDDPIYRFVDEGTSEHIISPKTPGGTLVFQWGGPGSYKAKTRPGILGSEAGGPSGPVVGRKFVIHPGTEARGFTAAIQKKMDKFAGDLIWKKVQAAIARKNR